MHRLMITENAGEYQLRNEQVLNDMQIKTDYIKATK